MPASGTDHALLDILLDWTRHTNVSRGPERHVQQITSLCDIKDVEAFCWSLWQSFIAAAQSVPDASASTQIDRLVHLVKAIKEAEPLLDQDGRIAACWGGECWKDLPLLGPQMRENWNSTPSNPTDLPAHLKKNIFAARLTQRGVADFSIYGLWALREALEGQTTSSPASPLKYSVPIAHAWIVYAGDTLIRLDKESGWMGKGGSLWHGQCGFCEDRWRFWRERLFCLSRSPELDPCTRAVAEEASVRIDALFEAGWRK